MSIHFKDTSTNMPGLTTISKTNPSAYETASTLMKKPTIIGLYGLPGSGKTFLLDQLKQSLDKTQFAFYEGSETITSIVPGGLDAFKQSNDEQQTQWRQRAIEMISMEAADSGRVAIVTGHFMFWAEHQEEGQPVYTPSDLNTYTHILYLDFQTEEIEQRRRGDKERSRPSVSITFLRKWQHAEKSQLRDLCYLHSILFSLISSQPDPLSRISELVRDFQIHTEQCNLSRVEKRLDEIMEGQDQLETVLLLDADRTLAAEDSGALFWKHVADSMQGDEHALNKLFSSPSGYSYTAFRQAMLLYEEVADDDFEALCEHVASLVTIYPAFLSLLRVVSEHKHVGAVIITCGLSLVWEKVLDKEGVSKRVKVIGGGRLTHELIVSDTVKGASIARLQTIHHKYVWAFGDSPLDLDMLLKADQAIVVVGEQHTRSKTMDAALAVAIDNSCLLAHQVLLPSNVKPRLNTSKLPIIQLPDLIDPILSRRGLQIFQVTEKTAAKLLMTPTRDAAMSGPALRKAHRRVGWYLATEYLGDAVGLEEYPIPHVQGHTTTGHRLLEEHKTSIVALMRGGEPMALGVNDAVPLAMFVHANHPSDIKLHHLQSTVVLVDSVVNSGKSVVEFLQHIRELKTDVRIVVVAGVVQAQCIPKLREQARQSRLNLVALRLSANKFTGSGTTDTGNRLFNTTHLP